MLASKYHVIKVKISCIKNASYKDMIALFGAFFAFYQKSSNCIGGGSFGV